MRESSSSTHISICGTVTLAVPRTRPAYPRISLEGEFFFKYPIRDCCYELQCLRNPNQITYRFDIEPAGWTTIGIGARSFDRSYTMFGYYGGTLSCLSDCSDFVENSCTHCGDNVVQLGETCDGTDLDGEACT